MNADRHLLAIVRRRDLLYPWLCIRGHVVELFISPQMAEDRRDPERTTIDRKQCTRFQQATGRDCLGFSGGKRACPDSTAKKIESAPMAVQNRRLHVKD